MKRNFYVRYSDSKKSERVSFYEFIMIRKMSEFYGAIVSSVFHPHGKTLTVSFSKHFV